MPVCTSSNTNSKPCSSHNRRSARRNSLGTTRTPPSPMIGSIRIAAGSGSTPPFGRFEVAERHLVEALDHRTEPVEIALAPAGGQRRERAAVEGALERDHAVAFDSPARRLIFARHFDRALHSFGAGIAEKHHVR